TWAREARQYGFSQQRVPTGPAPDRDEAKETREVISTSLSAVTRRDAHFAERDLVRAVATEAQGRGLGYRQVMKAVGETLARSPEIVYLGTLQREARFTTRPELALENRLVALAQTAKGNNAHSVRERSVQRAIRDAEKHARKQTGRPLVFTAEQREALHRLT